LEKRIRATLVEKVQLSNARSEKRKDALHFLR